MSSKLSITMCPTPASTRLAQLALGLRVAVQVDPRGVEAAAQREVQLAARWPTSQARPSSREQRGRPRCRGRPWRRTGPRRRRRGASASASRNVARAGAQVVLGHHVGRGPELARQLDDVAAADLEAAGLVEAAAQGVDVRERGHGHRGGIIPASVYSTCSTAASTGPCPTRPRSWASVDGLAYALFLPEGEPRGGVVILHGAGSCKESHFDFARAARAAGLAAVAFDQRGHGESDGRAGRPAARGRRDDGRARCRGPARPARVEHGRLRGAARRRAAGRGRGRGDLPGGRRAPAARPARAALRVPASTTARSRRFLLEHDLVAAVEDLRTPMLLLHAEGDEQDPGRRTPWPCTAPRAWSASG